MAESLQGEQRDNVAEGDADGPAAASRATTRHSASIGHVRSVLGGISGIHVTPYDSNGGIDEKLLARLVKRIAAAGIHNIVSGGNTGEFFSLAFDEVVRVHAVTFEAIGDLALRTAAVGRSLREAERTGRLAVAAGAQAIMTHYPQDPFAAPASQADYFIAVAESATVPTMAYLRSDVIRAEDVARIARHPNVAGIKFATPNLLHMADCMRAAGDSPCVWVCGLAEGWAPAFYGAGARGFTSGLINIDPQRSLKIWRALESGDFLTARTLIATVAGFEQMRAKFNNGANVTVVKEALRLTGWPVGPVRLPGLVELSHEDREALAAIVSALGHQISPTH